MSNSRRGLFLGALILLAAACVTEADAAKEKFVRTKPHVNIGAIGHSSRRGHELGHALGGSGRVLEELDGTGAVAREIVRAEGRPAWQVLADGSSQYFHEDPRGNVVMLTEGGTAGGCVARYVYDPHGRPVIQDCANNDDRDRITGNYSEERPFGNTLLFRGGWYDPETGQRGMTPETDLTGLLAGVDGRFLHLDEGRAITRGTPGAAGGMPVLRARSGPPLLGGSSGAPTMGTPAVLSASSGAAAGDPHYGWIELTVEYDPAATKDSHPQEVLDLMAAAHRPDIAGLFRDTAEGETGHAHGHLDYLKTVGDPATDSQANRRYLYFAKMADVRVLPPVELAGRPPSSPAVQSLFLLALDDGSAWAPQGRPLRAKVALSMAGGLGWGVDALAARPAPWRRKKPREIVVVGSKTHSDAGRRIPQYLRHRNRFAEEQTKGGIYIPD
jgi:hypothetical protein